MKTNRLIAVFALVMGYMASAQVASDYRIWEGHLYNVPKASLWTTIPPDVFIPKDNFVSGRPTGIKTYKGKVVNIGTSNILVKVSVDADGYVPDNDEWYNKLILIKNHPRIKTFVTGDVFPQDRFLFIGNQRLTNRNGSVIVVKSYTWGLPNTLENQKTLKK